MYKGTFYLYRDKIRYKETVLVRDRLEIPKQAMIYRIADELAGYTIHKDQVLVGEWWDRKARKNYAQAKSGGKGEL
tara:strand:- start:901 stop:1128 length:228 start_codon:yes stop_codon:yes gene_type:complete